jgi:predicted acetyltransferase
MVRLADAARALTLRGYPADGELDIVVAETSTAASKRLQLAIRNGTAEVASDGARSGDTEKGAKAPAIELSLATLGSIVASGMRPSEAAELGLLRADSAALAAADALFAGPRFQCLDPF